MLRYFISFFLFFLSINGFSQKEERLKVKKDSIIYKTNYGFRVGADISRPIISALDKGYSGFELVGDYRLTKRWYLASELGFESNITKEDFTKSSSKGSFIRLGANYNMYNNWLDMNNEIFIGGRYGFSNFEQTLLSYSANTGSPYFPSKTQEVNRSQAGLKAHWFEMQLGIKAETIKNLFVGFGVSYKIGISTEQQDNFQTLYVPGFNRVYESKTGFGFNYVVSYLIPFKRK